MTPSPLSWADLEAKDHLQSDRIHGPTNAQANLRLFGQAPEAVRVTLYRDHHGWCPYCQKIWLWLEEKQIPYAIKKVTMFCYGEKEPWYKRQVPSGMLPALALDGRIITESDEILIALERVYGPVFQAMEDPQVLPLRKLERMLFRAWCNWLCYPPFYPGQDKKNRQKFQEVVDLVEAGLAQTPGPYFLEEFSTVDIIFTPYVERMNASLYYYKGYSLREDNPRLGAWFDAMESRSTYRGTQSDFHTHVHDLPPQMGGCYSNNEPQAALNQERVDHGPWEGLPDATYPEPANAALEALHRVLKHRRTLVKLNPVADKDFDVALRCALTQMVTGQFVVPPPGTEVGLRYLRDRISVPRDMSVYGARKLRQALEITAALVSDRQGPELPVRHRRDQDPAQFGKVTTA